MGTIQIDGSTPKLTIGNATAEDALIVFDGNAQDFYIGLDDSADDLVIGLGSAAGTTPAISINEDRDVTISDGAIDFDVASHDTSNGLKLGGTLVTATAAELNIMDGVTATAAEINLIDGGTARGTTALADGDGILINDAGTMRMTNVTAVKTYMATAALAGIDDQTSSNDDQLTITDTAVIINEDSDDMDFRIESNGEANMFKVDGGDNTITIDGGTTTGSPVLKIIQYGGYAGFEIEGDASNTGSAYMNIDASGSGDSSIYLQSGGTSKWLTKNDYSDSHRLYIVDAGNDQGVYMDQDDTDWSSLSDERLKTDWVNISNAVDKIDTLTKVGQYKRKAYNKATNTIGDKKDKLHQGLSAQEIEAILPELISEDVNGIKGMSYTSLVPLLVKSIQELSARVKTLEG